MESTGETWRLRRLPALDGLRGIAILLVIVFHARVPSMWATGAIGVTVFFTLSGFLITSLLLGEHAKHGRVSLSGFYWRRALRLFPALGAFLVVMIPLSRPSWPDSLSAIFYVGNWRRALTGEAMGALGHTWSLAVEEQFYIVWPLVLLAALRVGGRRAVLLVASLGILASTIARLALWSESVWRVYFGTDTNAAALLVGCLLAAAMHGQRVKALPSGIATAAVAAIVALGLTPAGWWSYVAAPLAVPWLTSVAILVVAASSHDGWLGDWRLRWVGERSYGLYLWHFPFVWLLAPQLGWPWLPSVALVLTVAVVLTELSWRFAEQPCLKAKNRSGDRVEQRGSPRGDVLGRQPVRRQHPVPQV